MTRAHVITRNASMPLINHTRENVYERRSKNCHVPGEGVKDVVESVGYNKFDNSSMHYIDRQRKIGWLPVEIGIGKNWVKFTCILPNTRLPFV